MFDFKAEKVIYTKRYPSAQEEIEKAAAENPTPVTDEEVEAAYQKFLDFKNGERRYEPIPGRKEKSQRFIALAKKFSEEYEVGIDIWQTPYAIKVKLHMNCSVYPTDMTRKLAELLAMCDRLSPFTILTEPADFTLDLDFYTHRFYLSGRLVNG